MRLAYFHGNYVDSEEANVVQAVDMAQAFGQCGAAVTLIMGAPRDRSVQPTRRLWEHLGQQPTFEIVTYKKITVAGRLEILGNFFGVRSVLRTCEADMCFVDDPLILRLCLDAGFPTVFEAHVAELHNRNRWLNLFWKKDVLANVLRPKLLRFVTISQALAKIWRIRGVPEHKIVTAPDGFNPGPFEAVGSQSEARKKIGLPPERKIVVYSGRLHPNRGLERIIRLSRKFPSVLFVVVGGPEETRQLFIDISKREDASNILWVGQVAHAEVAGYLKAADVLLMLWTWDVPHIGGFSPLKMFEYMASQRIIVGDGFPTVKEVLVDGETAYLSDPDSFEELGMKLAQALSESYPSEIAINAYNTATSKYSWNTRARKILESVDGLA